MNKRKEYSEILGCSMHASAEEIEAAFKRKIRLYHTDRGGDNTKTALLCEAKAQMLRHIDSRRAVIPKTDHYAKIRRPKGNVFRGIVMVHGFCTRCNATGYIFPEDGPACNFCGGKGVEDGGKDAANMCLRCKGSGFVLELRHRCDECSMGSRRYAFRLEFEFDENVEDDVVVHWIDGGATGHSRINFVF